MNKPYIEKEHVTERQVSLGPITVASLAFLLNWLVFVDSSTISTVVNPLSERIPDFDRAGLLPGLMPSKEKNVLAFKTETYAVHVFRQSDQYYMNVYNRKALRTSLKGLPVVMVRSQDGTGYLYQGELEVMAFESTTGGKQLTILGEGASRIEEEAND